MNNIFDFVASNSSVEWSLLNFENNNGELQYQLGAYGLGGFSSQGGQLFSPGLKVNGKGINIIHSHPRVSGNKEKMESLYGDRGVSPSYFDKGFKFNKD